MKSTKSNKKDQKMNRSRSQENLNSRFDLSSAEEKLRKNYKNKSIFINLNFSIIVDDFIDDEPLLFASSKFGSSTTYKTKNHENPGKNVETDVKANSEKKVSSEPDSGYRLPERSILESESGFLYDDIIIPDIEPIEIIPVNIPGLLYLPEHGIEREARLAMICFDIIFNFWKEFYFLS